ncbi:MAG: hypothetical protein M3462_11115 [Chloroflexota bacterium]|nr:hypothetical protein [Chloroflexota bacterium]
MVSEPGWRERPVRIVSLDRLRASASDTLWSGVEGDTRAEVNIIYQRGRLSVWVGMPLRPNPPVWWDEDGTDGAVLTTADMIARLPGWITVEPERTPGMMVC